LGFQREGYKMVGAIEVDSIAAQTYARSLHPGPNGQGDPIHATPRNICGIDPTTFLAEVTEESRPEPVDVIIGGPPCQAFARVARAKLREIMSHPVAFLADERSSLYEHYMTFVEQLRPRAVLMENVPDLLNYGRRNLGEEMCETLEDLEYRCAYTLLNAAHYGVPQMRTRVFILGIRRTEGVEPSFPPPTHRCTLPTGYEGTKQVALRTLDAPLFTKPHYLHPPEASSSLPPAVTAAEALGDLPCITAHLTGELRRGVRSFDRFENYRDDVEPSGYALEMRNWPRFESKGGIYDHVIRSLPRDYQIFRAMRPGDQYPQAHEIAMNMFRDRLEELGEIRGAPVRQNSPEYRELMRSIVPPYDPGKFPNKWRKMEADKPSRTLMAHIGKDTYTHIHYDSEQARTISVREAARLQSFPDGFALCGHMNAAFRQIGNAVPPLMAAALARHILQLLGASRTEEAPAYSG